nr:Atxe2 family lasso peptide isopeptidase [Luteimonas sp. XNQY3]
MVTLVAPSYAGAISPRRLLEVADLGPPAVSPDGLRVAFRLEQASIERNSYDTVWYVQSMGGDAPPRRVAGGGTPLRNSAGFSQPPSAVWSPDGRWIYYRALIDGKIDVWRAAADGAGAEPLTRDPANVREFSLSADGLTLKYSVGATREEVIEAEQIEYDSGIRIDEMAPIGQPLFRSGVVGSRLATQRFGANWFNRVPLLADVPDRWNAIDLPTGQRKDLDPSDLPSSLSTATILATGVPEPWRLAFESGDGRIALLTRVVNTTDPWADPEVQLAMLPSKTSNRLVKCLADLCTNKAITGIQWRPDSDEVLFTVSDPLEGLGQSIFRWNVLSGMVSMVVRADGLINGGRDGPSTCGLSAQALACVAAEADRPPRLERIDLGTGERHVLFDPNMALALDIAVTVPARLLRWTDSNGQVLTGQFFPAQRTDDVLPPLFVTYYSCTGFLRGGVGDEWPLASLAEIGISALCVNNASNSSDVVERYSQALRAVESVVDLLASENEIDRARVGMGGLSFGSAVSLWTATESDLLAAVSVTSPVVSPNYYLLSSLKGDAFVTGLKEVWQLGAPEETPARWQRLSPAFNLDKINAPILMQMPEQEYIHALDYAIPLIRERRADLYVFPNEPHLKFQPRHVLAAYQRNLDWFRFWLQDYEDPDPAKREQYAHWREMRDARRKTP